MAIYVVRVATRAVNGYGCQRSGQLQNIHCTCLQSFAFRRMLAFRGVSTLSMFSTGSTLTKDRQIDTKLKSVHGKVS